MTASRAVLVTGCSSGIGHAIALRLHRAGLSVYATARRPETLTRLADRGIATLALDVLDEESMNTAVKRVVDDHGAVGILVNNAGYGMYGPVEDASLDQVRTLFETNVFGPLRLTQLVLPGMRAQRAGHIVTISSILGRISPPGGSHYQASKHAIEAYGDALRLEVAKFGVRVSLIEPGTVRTGFYASVAERLSGPAGGAYADFYRRLAAWANDMARGRRLAGRLAVSADGVAAAVHKAVTARNPRARYPVGLLSRSVLSTRRCLPDTLFDVFLRNQFPTP